MLHLTVHVVEGKGPNLLGRYLLDYQIVIHDILATR